VIKTEEKYRWIILARKGKIMSLLKKISAAILAALIAAVSIPAGYAYADSDDPTLWVMENQPLKTCSYTTQSLTHNSKFDGYSRYYGVDVSVYQGSINWTKVAAAGKKYAFVRVGYRGYSSGSLNADSYYKTNITNAYAAGIKVGAYFFSQAITTSEAKAEADYVISRLASYNTKISMPVVIDVEYAGSPGRLKAAGLSKTAQTNIALAFCREIAAAGYTPMVYASTSFFGSHFNMSSIASSYPVWVAQYSSSCSYTGTYNFWQYSSTGSVNGISGSADKDVWYTKDIDQYTSSGGKGASFTGQATNVKATTGQIGKIKVSWTKTAGATRYKIYRATKTGSFKYKASVTGSSYWNKGLKRGSTYRYKVLAMNGTTKGTVSSIVTGKAPSNYGYATAKVRLRKGYSTAYKTIRVTPKGKAVKILKTVRNKKKHTWYKVRYTINKKKYRGYIYSKYVR